MCDFGVDFSVDFTEKQKPWDQVKDFKRAFRSALINVANRAQRNELYLKIARKKSFEIQSTSYFRELPQDVQQKMIDFFTR